MMQLPDLTGLFVFAIVGLVATALVALAAVAGLVYFIVNHVQIV